MNLENSVRATSTPFMPDNISSSGDRTIVVHRYGALTFISLSFNALILLLITINMVGGATITNGRIGATAATTVVISTGAEARPTTSTRAMPIAARTVPVVRDRINAALA
jgi:microcompartment protein CcmK/EutM